MVFPAVKTLCLCVAQICSGSDTYHHYAKEKGHLFKARIQLVKAIGFKHSLSGYLYMYVHLIRLKHKINNFDPIITASFRLSSVVSTCQAPSKPNCTSTAPSDNHTGKMINVSTPFTPFDKMKGDQQKTIIKKVM